MDVRNNPLNIKHKEIGVHFFRMNLIAPNSLICVLCNKYMESNLHIIVPVSKFPSMEK
ncbi:MAG: hypothetical protein AABY07_10255 [Nanoarchaeota archaeon]